MRILAIETSCDETAIAIIEAEGVAPDVKFSVHADEVLSQIDIHKEYGGVFPMLAKREHARALVPLLQKTLKAADMYKKTSRHVIESPLRDEFQQMLEREPELFSAFIDEIPHIDPPNIDAIAVTQGPGLEPALWVGINFARALSFVWKVPVIAVNHMEGHLLAALVQKDGEQTILAPVAFPLLGLLVSGGHTELVLMKNWLDYSIIGETKDDAVGEAFDKVARILGLPYPGGPEISRLGAKGHPKVYPLPRPMLHSEDYNFSFSGLKTAVLYLVKKLGRLSDEQRNDIAREFEDACVEVLITKTLRAAEEYDVRTIVLGGGVSANTRLRATLKEKCEEQGGITLYTPARSLSTDNALMIAITAFLHQRVAPIADLRANGNWRLE